MSQNTASAELHHAREVAVRAARKGGEIARARVGKPGYLKWKGQRTFVSEVFARENVGLLEIDDDLFEVYYGPLLLGWFEGSEHVFEADRGPQRRHGKASAHDGAEASR